MDASLLGALIGGAVTIVLYMLSNRSQRKVRGKQKQDAESAAELTSAPELLKQARETLRALQVQQELAEKARSDAALAKSEAAAAKAEMAQIRIRFDQLEAENTTLRARVSELEAQVIELQRPT
jgi:chromosome segregation ATPase